MHLTKTPHTAPGDLLSGRVLLLGAALIPVTLTGAWVDKKIVGRISHRVFAALVEASLVVARIQFLAWVLSP